MKIVRVTSPAYESFWCATRLSIFRQKHLQTSAASSTRQQSFSGWRATPIKWLKHTGASWARAFEESLMSKHVCINWQDSKIADISHRCANVVACLAFPWSRQDAQAMFCTMARHTMQRLPSKAVFTLQSWLTHPVMKAAYTSGSLSLTGDLIAQLYSKRGNHVVCSLLNLHFCSDRWWHPQIAIHKPM